MLALMCPPCQSFSSQVNHLCDKTSTEDSRATYSVSIVSIKTLFYLMTSVVFYPFSTEIMQLYLIHCLTVSLSVWHEKKKQNKCVYPYVLYILYIHYMLSLALSLHDKCSGFQLCSHACALYFKTTVM